MKYAEESDSTWGKKGRWPHATNRLKQSRSKISYLDVVDKKSEAQNSV